MLPFSVLFPAETFINDYVVFVYSPLNLIMFFRMSNLIYPFASPVYAYDLYGVFYGLIFLFYVAGKIQCIDDKKRT